MAHAFQVGDHVRRKPRRGCVTGRIAKVHARVTRCTGRWRRCGGTDPRCGFRSGGAGHVAMHRRGVRRKVR
ncbi:MAG TPA: DUF2945 domain-containing protein [Pseudoxanthomonas sp.]|nr:DUF2945 domain-containing protein [Pseudoxanthomonas sp.]